MWLVHLSLDQALWIQALARDNVLYSWARYYSRTLYSHSSSLISTQLYKWVSQNLMLGVNHAMDYHPFQGEVENYYRLKNPVSAPEQALL